MELFKSLFQNDNGKEERIIRAKTFVWKLLNYTLQNIDENIDIEDIIKNKMLILIFLHVSESPLYIFKLKLTFYFLQSINYSFYLFFFSR